MPSSSWSLRARVAVAFLVTTAVAMLALGWFVQWRVQSTLEEVLRDQLKTQLSDLIAVQDDGRARAVEQLGGETHAQLMSRDGSVVASSPRLRDNIVVPAGGPDGYADTLVRVLDDEDEDDERASYPTGSAPGTEYEHAIVLVGRTDDVVLAVAISREDADDAVRAVRSQLLLSGPMALVLAGGIGYLVAGVGLRPIERVRSRAATISARSAGERLPVPSARELRRLTLTLNAMLDRLDEGLDRERRFAADASHELRTPLALLLTEVELALAAPRSHDELLHALRSAEQEVRRLIRLSESLLALAGAEVGHLDVHLEVVDLAGIAAEVVTRFSVTAAADNRSVSTHDDRAVLIGADPDQWRRVVSNLVDNAIRHGAGEVRVRVVEGDAEAVLEVSDEGSGFTEERPFERFAASHGSIGLGLPIVDEIVRAHGGTTVIARENNRTVVRVTLPK